MKDIIIRFGHFGNKICATNDTEITSFNRLNTISFIGAILFVAFVSFTLGLNNLVLISFVIPIAGFSLAYYLNYKKFYGLGLLINAYVALFHASIVVYSYDNQFLELVYLFVAIVPWFPINNLKLLKTTHLLSFICFLIFGFHLKNYNLFEMSQWPVSIFIYFVLMNTVFIGLYQFLIIYKKNSLIYIQAIIKKNKEIEDQNDLIKLNTKMIIKFEHDRTEMELANKQKDVELLNLNNQLKIKMKNDLIKELQKLKRKESNIVAGVKSIINKLKHQIEEEKKIDLLQNNIRHS